MVCKHVALLPQPYFSPIAFSPRVNSLSLASQANGPRLPTLVLEDGTMSTTGFDLIADGIDANLDHLHN